MIVKVCGMCHSDNIRQVERIGVDWMGFIFHPLSPRYVSVIPDYLPQSCKRVGVVVNKKVDEVVKLVDSYGLHIVQLHGNESSSYCRYLRNLLPQDVKLMKVFSVGCEADVARTASYESVADYFLFDTRCNGYGGSGHQFKWKWLQAYEGQIPFLLSGGIGPEDASLVARFNHPRLVGIDLNSRFESAPGRKDIERLTSFIHELQSMNLKLNFKI